MVIEKNVKNEISGNENQTHLKRTKIQPLVMEIKPWKQSEREEEGKTTIIMEIEKMSKGWKKQKEKPNTHKENQNPTISNRDRAKKNKAKERKRKSYNNNGNQNNKSRNEN